VTYSEHTLLSNQLDERILHGANRVALRVGGDVAEISDMALRVAGSTVILGEGVDWAGNRSTRLVSSASRRRDFRWARTVRSGRGAAVGVVTELVDVEATLGVGILAGDVP
jgi:hypothetical protein